MEINYCDICGKQIPRFRYWGDNIEIEIGSKNMRITVCKEHNKQFQEIVKYWAKQDWEDLVKAGGNSIPWPLTHNYDREIDTKN